MSCPLHHRYLTDASNRVSEAFGLLSEAAKDDPSYKPLLDEIKRLHKHLSSRWEKNCKRGKKEEWWQ